ncbi:CHASE domain-containing protein [Gilvimarinus chinensis]|uniref:CHASE domain-containing protein n=1 Tax=Gilvimarinus chinensis TaxID=396005 RepID=UPI000368BF90|nr:CHASE domain-containing protein [Gilvimarinus chinensis]
MGQLELDTLRKIIYLAFSYWGVGSLALLMAIPSGFASALFPPMGMAIGAVLLFGVRLLPGVFLGSLFLSLMVSAQSAQGLTMVGGVLAVGIGLGSSLSVIVAWGLARFILRGRRAFAREGDIASLLVACGPVACLVSATLCTLMLLLCGIIEGRDFSTTWWTWWLGDSIGVMLALPMMYVFFAQPAGVWRGRILSVGLPIVIATGVMVVVFVRINRAELERLDKSFQQLAVPYAANFASGLDHKLAILKSIDGLFQASESVSFDDFQRFNEHTLEGNEVLHAVSWNARISGTQREAEERQLMQQGLPGVITERSAEGELLSAPKRDEYVYIKYIIPAEGNNKAQNFNIGALPNRRAALERSASSGEARMTAPIKLVQDTITSKALLVFYPVYFKGTKENRWENIKGFATAVVIMEQLISRMNTGYGVPPNFVVAVDYIGEHTDTLATVGGVAKSELASLLRFEQTYPFAGAAIRLTLTPNDAFVRKYHSPLTWTVLAGGFLFCALLGGFLLSLSVRSERIHELVEERTTELSSILNSAADAILTVNSLGAVERYNPAALTLFAASGEQLQGSTIDTWLDIFTAAGKGVDDVLNNRLNGTFETTLTTLEGQRHAVEVGISQMQFGEDPRYVLMLHNITEHKKTEKLKSEFISTVSHELRTPLTSIIGSLKLVSSGVVGDISEKTANLVTIATDNAERLSVLVNDILDIEKLDFDQLKIEIAPVAVIPAVRHVMRQMQAYADGFEVTLSLEWAETLTKEDCVSADAHRLAQVLTNLLSNAIKYSNSGGTVILSLTKDDESLVISVKDFGRGMPEYFRKQIFQKFSQADSSDKRERSGTGLGLYIAKALVEKMRGSIGFESELGKGSEFFIRLPLAKVK